MKWQDVSKILVGVGGVIGLFSYLFLLTGMDYTHSGDSECFYHEDIYQCDACINLTTRYWNFEFEHLSPDTYIYLPADLEDFEGKLTRYRAGDLDFIPVLYKKSTYGRKLWINLDMIDNIIDTQPSIKVDWMVPTRGKDNWRHVKEGDTWSRLKNNRIKLIGYPENTNEDIKWSFIVGEVDIDPVWIAIDKECELKDAIIEISDKKIDKYNTKEIVFTNLDKDFNIKEEAEKVDKEAKDYINIKKTNHYGDIDIKLMHYINITENVSYDCNCYNNTIETNKTNIVELVCDTCYKNITKEVFREINPETFVLRNNEPIYEVFGDSIKFEELPDGGWGYAVWTDITVMGVEVENATWANATFLKRKPIYVNNTDLEVYNYSFKFEFDWDTDMLNDMNDTRFTNSTGTSLSYWIESKNDGVNATVWVKDPNLLVNSTNTTYYHYYDNDSVVSSESDIKTAFLFADDFNDNSYDTNQWDEVYFSGSGCGSITEANGKLKISATRSGTNCLLYSISKTNLSGIDTITTVDIIDSSLLASNYHSIGLHYEQSNSVNSFVGIYKLSVPTPYLRSYHVPDSYSVGDISFSATSWNMTIIHTDTWSTKYDDTIHMNAYVETTPMIGEFPALFSSAVTTNGNSWIESDNIISRVYLASEPTYSFGPEEVSELTITIVNPTNITYGTTSVDLNWTNSTITDWIGYSLNGAGNITITGDLVMTATEGSNHVIVWGNDTSGVMTYDEEWFTVTISPPIINNLNDNSGDYVQNKDWVMWANVTDEETPIDTVFLEIGGMNYTCTNNTVSNFSYTISDLGVDSYTYKFYANNTYGDIGNSTDGTLTITQADTSIKVYLNDTDGSATVPQGDINITIILNISGKTVYYYRNSSLMQSDTTPLENISSWTSYEDYNISGIFNGDTNYTSSQTDVTLTISDTIKPTITIESPTNTTYNTKTVWFNVTSYDISGVDWCGYSLDDTDNITMTNSSGNWNAVNTSMWDTYHEVVFSCNDTSGNINSTSIEFTSQYENVTRCTTLDAEGRYYYLRDDIPNIHSGNCIIVTGNHITFDGMGHIIDGDYSTERYGVYNYQKSNFTLKNVTMTDWYSGMYYLDVSIGNIEDSGFSGSVYGILLEDSDHINLTNVNVYNNDGHGIYMDNTDYSIFDNCNITSSTNKGVYYISGSNYNEMYNCRIVDNTDQGIYLTSSSNSFYNNLFNNTVNLGSSGTSNNLNTTQQTGTRIHSNGVEIGGNYWSNSTGNDYSDTCTDADFDGFCDNSYTLATNNIDYLPYSKLYGYIVIILPENITYGVRDLTLNWTSITNVTDANYSLNGNTNTTLMDGVNIKNVTLNESRLLTNSNNVTIYIENGDGDKYQLTRYFSLESTPPTWRNLTYDNLVVLNYDNDITINVTDDYGTVNNVTVEHNGVNYTGTNVTDMFTITYNMTSIGNVTDTVWMTDIVGNINSTNFTYHGADINITYSNSSEPYLMPNATGYSGMYPMRYQPPITIFYNNGNGSDIYVNVTINTSVNSCLEFYLYNETIAIDSVEYQAYKFTSPSTTSMVVELMTNDTNISIYGWCDFIGCTSGNSYYYEYWFDFYNA